MKRKISIVLIITLSAITIYLILNIKKKHSIIEFKTKTHNFGKIYQGEEKKHYFVFFNRGNGNLLIKSFSTSCGCTVAKPKKSTIKPNQKDSILISFKSSKTGSVTQEIMIYSNSKSSPDHLFIQGNVVKK